MTHESCGMIKTLPNSYNLPRFYVAYEKVRVGSPNFNGLGQTSENLACPSQFFEGRIL